MNAMKAQLSHQYPSGRIDFCGQTEFNSELTEEEFGTEFDKWSEEIHTVHPLPKDCKWLVECKEIERA